MFLLGRLLWQTEYLLYSPFIIIHINLSLHKWNVGSFTYFCLAQGVIQRKRVSPYKVLLKYSNGLLLSFSSGEFWHLFLIQYLIVTWSRPSWPNPNICIKLNHTTYEYMYCLQLNVYTYFSWKNMIKIIMINVCPQYNTLIDPDNCGTIWTNLDIHVRYISILWCFTFIIRQILHQLFF